VADRRGPPGRPALRDLDEVEQHLAEAEQGRFRVERLPFYLAGIPTYVVVGELAIAKVLVGALPRPEFPAALREQATRFWAEASRLSLNYAEEVYAARGDALGCAGGSPGRWSRPRTAGWPPGACGP
jgi:hypothetical protein